MELPFANTEYCLAALLKVIRTFNADPHLRPSLRFELADHLESYVAMLVERTERPLLSTAMPHLPTVHSAEQGTSLYREMAVAYLLACPAKSLLGSLWQREELCQASYRSLRHWGWYLLGMAQLYKSPEEGFWPSVYRVYRQAEEFGVISRPLDVPDEPPACRNVRGIFKRILLFALGGSGRFRPRDMRHVYMLLGSLADSVTLEPRPPDRGGGRFCVRLDTEYPPFTYPEDYKTVPTDRFFCTGDLIACLVRDPVPLKSDHFGDSHHWHLQNVLAKSLNGGKNRKSSRLKAGQECQLFIGLPDIIDALSSTGNSGSTPSSSMPLANLDPIDWTRRTPYELAPVETGSRKRHWSEEPLLGQDAFIEQIVMDGWSHVNDTVETANPPFSNKSRMMRGLMINTSPHGYCIAVAETGQVELQIGVPIGIVEEGGALFLGTVRWLMREEAGVRFGVKLLSPGVKVVDICLLDGTSKGKGLLLPADRILRHDPELVVTPRVFRVNSELRVEGRNTPPRVYLGQICEQTLAFTRLTLTASRIKSDGRA